MRIKDGKELKKIKILKKGREIRWKSERFHEHFEANGKVFNFSSQFNYWNRKLFSLSFVYANLISAMISAMKKSLLCQEVFKKLKKLFIWGLLNRFNLIHQVMSMWVDTSLCDWYKASWDFSKLIRALILLSLIPNHE